MISKVRLQIPVRQSFFIYEKLLRSDESFAKNRHEKGVLCYDKEYI